MYGVQKGITTFHTSIATEFRAEARDCCTPLFFICRSLLNITFVRSYNLVIAILVPYTVNVAKNVTLLIYHQKR